LIETMGNAGTGYGAALTSERIVFDRRNATQLCTQLTADSIEMIPFGQGFASMSPLTRELEKLIIGSQLPHGGHPILRWMASNVAIKQDPAGNLKPDKGKSTERIDGIVVLIKALGRAMLQEDETKVVIQWQHWPL
jgi:phage terminase large subunit-like protein